MSKIYDYDLFVIGGGSGGVACARRAASYGAKVAIAEKDRFGGTCVLRGCVPKKLLMYGSHFSEIFEEAKAFGWSFPEKPQHSWPILIQNKNKEIARLASIYEDLLQKSGVTKFNAYAKLTGAHEVELDGKKITAKHILLATGGFPWVPDFKGSKHTLTSNEILNLSKLPKKLAIIGGGYIAVEFASIFHGLGVEVEMLIRSPCVLAGFDFELATNFKTILKNKGIKIRESVNVEQIEKCTSNSYKISLKEGGEIQADLVFAATGRRPNLEAIDFNQVPINLSSKGGIQIDAYARTSVPSIFAIGDVTAIASLTPVAIRQGRELAEYLFNKGNGKADISVLPTAVFTTPPIGTVGMTEEKALDKYEAVDIYKSTFKHMKHSLSDRDEKIFMKLITDHHSQKILGIHMIGDDAPEIIQMAAIAIACNATKAEFDRTVPLHPTAAEEFITMRDFTTKKGKDHDRPYKICS